VTKWELPLTSKKLKVKERAKKNNKRIKDSKKKQLS
jgi:hypothetical protein